MVTPSDIHKANVLIVDDRAADALLLKNMLAGAGFTSVASTTDPQGVCDLHLKNRYDLILLDLLMPGMYGFQVIEALKEIEADGDVPVLVVSSEPDYKLRAMQAGAKEFIIKPLVRADVLAKVQDLLQLRLSKKGAQHDRSAEQQAVHERSARLRDSEEMFRQLASFCPDALWVREIKSDLIRYVNPAWEKITGRRLAAGDRSAKVFAALHPDDRQRVLDETETLPRGGVNLECRIVWPDDTVRWVHIRTFPIGDPKRKTARIAGIMEDVTARKTPVFENA